MGAFFPSRLCTECRRLANLVSSFKIHINDKPLPNEMGSVLLGVLKVVVM